MWLPDPNQLGVPTTFTSQSSLTGTGNVRGAIWVKPPNISCIYIYLQAPGGGGGGGAGQAAAADTGGGGGGAAGNQATIFMPAQYVPDALHFSIGAGGLGGAGGALGSGSNGGQAGTSRLHSANGDLLLNLQGGNGGNGGTSTAAGIGGATGGVPGVTTWVSCGLFLLRQAGSGSDGGFGAVGVAATRNNFSPGAGGGGPRTTSDRDGGAQSALLGYPAVPGGTITTTPSSRVGNFQPFFASGGPGGAGTFGTTPGQQGADGWFGCGGGGGGGCNNIAGATGGAGGRGGDGIAWIWSW